MKKIVLVVLLSLFMLISGCTPSSSNDKPVVMVSLFPQYDFVRAIAQDKVELVLLLPPGVEPHSYEPTPATIIQIVEADLFIYTNAMMEPWIDRIVENVKGDSLLLLDSSVGIGYIQHHHDDHDDHGAELYSELVHIISEWKDAEITAETAMDEVKAIIHDYLHLEDDHDHDDHDDDHDDEHHHDEHFEELVDHIHHIIHEYIDGDISVEAALAEIDEKLSAFELDDHDDHDHDSDDPHVWLEPRNAMIMVNNILEGLIQIDPANEAFYRNNAQAYLSELEALDDAFVDLFSRVKTKTIIYGGHFAFGYLANRFDLTILSPYTGFSPDAEPTAQAIAQLIDTMRTLNIDTIYFEELVDPKTARVLSEQTGATMMLLHGAHNVTTQEREDNVTYLQLMYDNIERLKIGLQYE